MQRKQAHQAQRGFVTVAQNSPVGDYLTMAYVQAMSIKATMPEAQFAVIVDANTEADITEKHRKVFDYVIVMEKDHAENDDWKLANDWQIFWLTPFKETIRLEADVIVPRSIAHWWAALARREMVLGQNCRDYLGNICTVSPYRKIFRDNALPDTYSGIMYFRYSKTATEFFLLAKEIFTNWSVVSTALLKPDAVPTTDVVYALAAKILGPEQVTLPVDFFNFVHMKTGINGWPDATDYINELTIVVDSDRLLVNNILVTHPFHYHNKQFITPEIIATYERATNII